MTCFKNLNILSLIVLVGFTANAAPEKVGKIEIEEVLFRPTLVTIEESGGEFDLSDSSFSLRWRRDKKLSAFMAVGSTLERNLPIYYAAENKDEVGFYEAYAEYEGLYGRVRFGLIPLGFSYDGKIAAREEIFSDSMLFTERIMGFRDYGLSLYSSHNGYFTEIIAHNGEIDTETDGRLFATGHWGWTDSRKWTTQMSLQAGSVQGHVSDTGAAPVTPTIAGVTNGESANWRHGAFYLQHHPRDWNVVLQLTAGSVDQTNYTGDYASWLFEVSRMFSRNAGVGFRVDELDPNKDLNGDKVTKTHLALMLRSNDATSNLYLVGTKVSEETNDTPNDELRLVWFVTPFAN